MESRCKRCSLLAELKQSQKHLREILQESRDVLYYYSLAADCFEYISPSIESMTGYPAEEFLTSGGTRCREVIHPADQALYITLEKALKTNPNKAADITLECRIRRKQDGRYIWISNRIRILCNKKGNAAAVVGSVRDITHCKQLQQQLEESEAIYRSLFDYAPIALYRNRIQDCKLLECNEYFRQLFGYTSKEECLQKNYASSNYARPEERKKILERLAKEKQIQYLELELKRTDGSTFWGDVSVKLLPEQGYTEGAIRDISLPKALSAAEKQILRFVLEGKSNKEIAGQLHRSVRTIEDHRAHIMHKLHCHNLIELVQKSIPPLTS